MAWQISVGGKTGQATTWRHGHDGHDKLRVSGKQWRFHVDTRPSTQAQRACRQVLSALAGFE